MLAAAGAALSVFAADSWLVDRAPIRFELQVADKPAVAEAGVIAILPDCGLLPRPSAEPVVVAADGRTILRSDVLWHNSSAGYGIVFEPPPAGSTVTVYLKPSAAAPSLGDKSPFKPSLLLYTRNTAAPTLEMAFDLGKSRARVGFDLMMGQVKNIGQRWNQFGLDDNYISYYTGWLNFDKQTRVYIATISDEGSELRIDGRSVASWPGLHTREGGAKGEYGSWQDLAPGLHKIEYFHFEQAGIQEAHALWTFSAISKDNKPQTIPETAYVKSAVAQVLRGACRDGRPVVTMAATGKSYLWVGKTPVNLYHLAAALTDGNPADTVYNWIISDQSPKVTSKGFLWLIDKERESPVPITLSAISKAGTTTITKPLLMWPGPPPASVNNAADRQIYRDALLGMCRAVPADKDPCAKWSPDTWATMLAVIEPYRGLELIVEVMGRSRKSIEALPAAERRFCEDVFFEAIRVTEPPVVVKWLDRLEQEEKDRDRKFYWKQAKVDYFLNDRGNTNEARRYAAQMQASAGKAEENMMVMIRLGDIARAEGNYDEARRLYGQAQDRFLDRKRNTRVAVGGPTPSKTRLISGGLTREEQRVSKAPPKPAAAPPPASYLKPPPMNWKTFAVQEASFYAEAKKMIEGGFFFEAREIMREWEVEFPLCKLSGDYPLAEAEYYFAAGRYERALRTLELYQRGIDLSSALPEAWTLQLDCLEKLGRGKEAQALAKDIVKRLPNHPVADRARRIADYGI